MSRAGSKTGGEAAGFTLIELVVVLFIAGLLIAVAPPLISAAMPGVELKGTAREIAAALRFARNQAVLRQTDAAVRLDLEARRYSVSGRPKLNAIPEGIAVDLDTVQAELTEGRGGSIRFFPDGSSTGGRVTLSRGEAVYKVDVDWLTGRVRIVD